MFSHIIQKSSARAFHSCGWKCLSRKITKYTGIKLFSHIFEIQKHLDEQLRSKTSKFGMKLHRLHFFAMPTSFWCEKEIPCEAISQPFNYTVFLTSLIKQSNFSPKPANIHKTMKTGLKHKRAPGLLPNFPPTFLCSLLYQKQILIQEIIMIFACSCFVFLFFHLSLPRYVKPTTVTRYWSLI